MFFLLSHQNISGKKNKTSSIPPTNFDLRGMKGGWSAGSNAQSDTKRWGQYLRVCKCRHGSSGGVTPLDTGLTMRAHPHGRWSVAREEEGEEEKAGKEFKGHVHFKHCGFSWTRKRLLTRFVFFAPRFLQMCAHKKVTRYSRCTPKK